MLNSNGFMPKPNKEHKFFEKYLDNDLDALAKFLEEKYKLIEEAKLRGVSTMENDPGYWLDSKSLSTVKWREYNVFQFYNASIYKLYKEISNTVKDACEYYDVDFDAQQYYIQGWFNINSVAKGGKLNWHDHGGPFAPHFHGYYCVNAEPSITHYQINDGSGRVVDNINKNNRLIISEMGHPHAMGDWAWEGSRITIAYDIEPLSSLLRAGDSISEQHWIPLL